MSEVDGPGSVHAETFAVIPEWLVNDLAVSGDALRLYAILRRYADSKGYAHPFRRTLVERMGGPSKGEGGRGLCSLRTVSRLLAQLVDAGAICIEHQPSAEGRSDLGASRYLILSRAPVGVVSGMAPHVVPPVARGWCQEWPGGGVTGDPRVVSPLARLIDERESLNESQVNESVSTEVDTPFSSSDDDSVGFSGAEITAEGRVGGSVPAVTTSNGNGHPDEIPTLLDLTPITPASIPVMARKRQVPRGARDRELVTAFLEVWQYQYRFYSGEDGTLPTCRIPNMAAIPKEGGDRWRLILGVMRHDAVAAVPGADAPQVLYGAIEAFMVDARARESGWEADTFCRHVDRWIDKATAPVPGSPG